MGQASQRKKDARARREEERAQAKQASSKTSEATDSATQENAPAPKEAKEAKVDPRDKGSRQGRNIKEITLRDRLDVLASRDQDRRADIQLLREDMLDMERRFGQRIAEMQNLFAVSDITHRAAPRAVIRVLLGDLRDAGIVQYAAEEAFTQVVDRLAAVVQTLSHQEMLATVQRLAEAHNARLRETVDAAKLTPEQIREAKMNADLEAELAAAAARGPAEDRPTLEDTQLLEKMGLPPNSTLL